MCTPGRDGGRQWGAGAALVPPQNQALSAILRSFLLYKPKCDYMPMPETAELSRGRFSWTPIPAPPCTVNANVSVSRLELLLTRKGWQEPKTKQKCPTGNTTTQLKYSGRTESPGGPPAWLRPPPQSPPSAAPRQPPGSGPGRMFSPSGVESSWEARPEGLDPRSSNFQVSWRELLASEEDLWVWWPLPWRSP